MKSQASSSELNAVKSLALAAGEVIGERLHAVHVIDPKAGTEFVTEVDRLSEDLVLAGLAKLFPGEAVVAEESGAHPGEGGRTWYIDPLDGTTNFTHGYPFFCVSIGARDEHGLVLGAVCAPALGECFLAGRGLGARVVELNGGRETVLAPRTPVALKDALLATGFPYLRDELVGRNTDLVKAFLMAPCHGVRRAGSAALDLCHVAAGRLDGYWEFRLRPWDTAAGALVARECGVQVTEADGAACDLPFASILAAAPRLYEAMLAILREEPSA